MPKITNIKQAVKNENRVNVFVDEEYCFSLDIAQLVDFKLKIGTELDKDDIEKYKKASSFGKMYQRTLEWVLIRPHSVRETKDYLIRKKVDTEDIKQIIDILISKKYLNDEYFAKYYVENRFVKKGISKKRMQMELIKKGIDRKIIEDIMNSGIRNDEDEIKKIIAKKRAKYDDEKLIQYLVRQGFAYDLARSLVLNSYETD